MGRASTDPKSIVMELDAGCGGDGGGSLATTAGGAGLFWNCVGYCGGSAAALGVSGSIIAIQYIV